MWASRGGVHTKRTARAGVEVNELWTRGGTLLRAGESMQVYGRTLLWRQEYTSENPYSVTAVIAVVSAGVKYCYCCGLSRRKILRQFYSLYAVISKLQPVE